MARAFLFTPGDGRPTANAFWMPDHAQIIPRVEKALRENGMEPVWLHSTHVAVHSWAMAKEVGRKLLDQAQSGDALVVLMTGWAWPEHSGILFTMNQDKIRSGELPLIQICNLKEKAPGYVGQRASVLNLEIQELPYSCLTIIDPSEAGWANFAVELKAVLHGTYKVDVPRVEIEVTGQHERTAREAIRFLKEAGSVIPFINVASLHMAQGWPNLYEFKKMGLTPIFIGSNEFWKLMSDVPLRRVLGAYEWLQGHGLQFIYEEDGLCEEEIFQALRMYLAKLKLFEDGAAGMGTQGMMDTTSVLVATDLSESLMMSTDSPFKERPVIDVTEADCEALGTSMLAQAILYVKFGKWLPVGFHDIRHYNPAEDTLVLLNSGALALDFMTDTPADYRDIRAVSQNRQVYYLNGGACIEGNMRARENACLFRLHGKGSTYTMVAAQINILPLTWEKRREVYGELDHWPMGIVQMPKGKTRATTLSWIPNHGHHTNENILPELKAACHLLGYGFHCFAA